MEQKVVRLVRPMMPDLHPLKSSETEIPEEAKEAFATAPTIKKRQYVRVKPWSERAAHAPKKELKHYVEEQFDDKTLKKFLDTLPCTRGQVAELAFLKKMDAQAITDLLQISLSSVNVHIYHARQNAKEFLGQTN